jgi:CBS-domain-containing membrane protein
MELINKKNELMVLAAIVTILLFVMGYTLYNRTNKSNQPVDFMTKQLTTQSETDDINSIEADLNNTDLDNIDKEIQGIESELNQAY